METLGKLLLALGLVLVAGGLAFLLLSRSGGGRKPITETDPTLREDLERLLDDGTRGDPELPLRWTSKSVRKLAEGLRELGHEVSYRTVARLLRALGYSLQANRKTHAR